MILLTESNYAPKGIMFYLIHLGALLDSISILKGKRESCDTVGSIITYFENDSVKNGSTDPIRSQITILKESNPK